MSSIFQHMQTAFQDIDVAMGLFIGVLLVFGIVILIAFLYTNFFLSVQIKITKKAPEIEKLKDVNKLKGVLFHIVSNFQFASEKGQTLDARVVTENRIDDLSFFGWSFRSIGKLSKTFPFVFLFIGLAFALVLPETPTVMLVFLSIFFVLWILSSIFSVEDKIKRLENHIIAYINEELARFFIPDTTNAISMLRFEVTSAIKELSAALLQSLHDVANQFERTANETYKNVEDITSTSLHWLEEMPALLEENRMAEENSVKELRQLVLDTTTLLDTQALHLSTVGESTTSQIEQARKIFEAIEKREKNLEIDYSVIQNEIALIEENQALVTKSVESFEFALQEISTSIGAGFGNVMEYHLQDAYRSMNSEVVSQINSMNKQHAELITTLEGLFEELLTYSKTNTSTMMHLQEQINMQLQDLEDKMNINK